MVPYKEMFTRGKEKVVSSFVSVDEQMPKRHGNNINYDASPSSSIASFRRPRQWLVSMPLSSSGPPG